MQKTVLSRMAKDKGSCSRTVFSVFFRQLDYLDKSNKIGCMSSKVPITIGGSQSAARFAEFCYLRRLHLTYTLKCGQGWVIQNVA